MNLTKLIDIRERVATDERWSVEERDYLLIALNRSIQLDRISTLLGVMARKSGKPIPPAAEEFLDIVNQPSATNVVGFLNDEIGRLRSIVRVNGLRHGATDAEIDAMLYPDGKPS